jgi:hypothetical protein
MGTLLAGSVTRAEAADGESKEFSLEVLSAPWLFLMDMQITGNARHGDDGWLVSGMLLGVPLWGMWRLLLRRVREMIILGPAGPGNPLCG